MTQAQTVSVAFFMKGGPAHKEIAMKHTAKSYLEDGNLTRGEYGVKPQLTRVSWDPETNGWVPDDDGNSWGAWDPDFGWMAPWPDADVVEDTE